MYLRVSTPHLVPSTCAAVHLAGLGANVKEVPLFLPDKLGFVKHRLVYRTESPPTSVESYPYERVATVLFKHMDGPYSAAVAAKGAWVRFDADVGWLFWMRAVNGRAELKLSPGTQAIFGEMQRHLQLAGTAPISVELWDAPQASTSRGRVALWLFKNLHAIIATEQKYSVDRRGIAGAIAWEALYNPWPGTAGDLITSTGAAKFSGPGKVHYKADRFVEGISAAIEVEKLGRLPVLTMDQRRQVLSTLSGALMYSGVILREVCDIAGRSGYYLDCDPPMLATFFNSWDIADVERLFASRKAPAPIEPNPGMGTWVKQNIKFIEAIVGTPPNGFCKRARGY
jgi:hypothetical protein